MSSCRRHVDLNGANGELLPGRVAAVCIHSVLCCRVLSLHAQASPVARTPSMPPVDTSYIPPPPPLHPIQDYRHYYHTPNDLSGTGVRPALLQLLALMTIPEGF